jgi:hypothetical protein
MADPMTPQHEAELAKALKDLSEELRILRQCLFGNPQENPPIKGVLDIVYTHRNELYGDESTLHLGLKQRILAVERSVEDIQNNPKMEKRVKVLEEAQKKVYWAWGGIAASVPLFYWLLKVVGVVK